MSDTPNQAKDFLRSLTIRPVLIAEDRFYRADDVIDAVEGVLAHAADLGAKRTACLQQLLELRQRLANGKGKLQPRSQVYDALSTVIEALRNA